MANKPDIDRWQEGKEQWDKESWNKWADDLLEKKKKLRKEKKWSVDKKGNGNNEETIEWINSASLDFSGHIFHEDSNFKGFKFPYDVNFTEVTFLQSVSFKEAKFFGYTQFDEVIFKTFVSFEKVEFYGNANFSWSNFNNSVAFDNGTFKEKTEFTGATFKTFAGFEKSEFFGETSFRAINVLGPFTLAYVKFHKFVPDFNYARFPAAVRLDNVEIIHAPNLLRSGDKDRAARYRALKKMAIETHDHVRELEFFASESRERRGNDDPKGSAKYIVGFAYEIFSDFGRSFVRPLVGLAALSIVFTFVYLLTRDLGAWLKCGPDGLVPMGKAAYLSFVNSMPFIGLGKAEQIKQVSNCLYGTAALPLGITILTTVQTVLSTVLIFLFFLAVRNHFRIK